MTSREEYLLDTLHHIEAVARAAINAVAPLRQIDPGNFGLHSCKELPPALPRPFGRWCSPPPDFGRKAEVVAGRRPRKARRSRKPVRR